MKTALGNLRSHLNTLNRQGYSQIDIVNLLHIIEKEGGYMDEEKKQILDAYKNGCDLGWEETRAEQYFKDTYEDKEKRK